MEPKMDEEPEPSKISTTEPILAPEPAQNEAEMSQDTIQTQSMDAAVLIGHISAGELLECLKNVYEFLNDDEDEQAFPNISKYVEEFLMRIVIDYNVLKCDNMPGDCVELCNKIIEMVQSKSDNKIFRLSCIYKAEPQDALLAGIGADVMHILVYKKLYHTQYGIARQSRATTSPIGSRSRSSLSQASQRSRSSSSEPDNRSTINLPSSEHFQNHCLHLILKFIKDKDQTRLEFTGLSVDEAVYIYTKFRNITCKKKFKGGSVCTALKEAAMIVSLDYEFQIRYVDSVDDTKSLLLEKRAINRSRSKTKKNEKQLTPRKKSKYLQRFRQLTEPFIMNTLTKMINFYNNDAEGSILFLANEPEEKRFLKNIINFSRSERIKSIFNDDIKKIFDDLLTLIDKPNHFKVKVKEKKNKFGNKEVLYIKVPSYDKSVKMSRPWYPKHSATSNKGVSSTVSPSHDTASDPSSCSKPKDATVDTSSRSVSRERKVARKSEVSFDTGGVINYSKREGSLVYETDRDVKLIEAMKKYTNTTILTDPPRKLDQASSSKFALPNISVKSKSKLKLKKNEQEKLIEALSVPVHSDKAMKMMMSMGWKGGALGSRGTGLIEPIMPDLNNAKGVGLGHSSESAKSSPQRRGKSSLRATPVATVVSGDVSSTEPTFDTTLKLDSVCNQTEGSFPQSSRVRMKQGGGSSFRREFLTQVAWFVSQDLGTMELSYDRPLSKQENRFSQHMVRGFSQRFRLTLSDQKEQALIDQIAGEFAKDPQLRLTASLAKTSITLGKFRTDMQPGRRDMVDPPVLTEDLTNDLQNYLQTFAPFTQTAKGYEKKKFKVDVLLKIYHFIKSKNIVRFMDFGRVLLDWEVDYITKCFNSSNRMAKFGAAPVEIPLTMEIRKIMLDFNIYAKYEPDLTAITAVKIYQVPYIRRKLRFDPRYVKVEAMKLHEYVTRELNKCDDIIQVAKKINKLTLSDEDRQTVVENYDDRSDDDGKGGKRGGDKDLGGGDVMGGFGSEGGDKDMGSADGNGDKDMGSGDGKGDKAMDGGDKNGDKAMDGGDKNGDKAMDGGDKNGDKAMDGGDRNGDQKIDSIDGKGDKTRDSDEKGDQEKGGGDNMTENDIGDKGMGSIDNAINIDWGDDNGDQEMRSGDNITESYRNDEMIKSIDKAINYGSSDGSGDQDMGSGDTVSLSDEDNGNCDEEVGNGDNPIYDEGGQNCDKEMKIGDNGIIGVGDKRMDVGDNVINDGGNYDKIIGSDDVINNHGFNRKGDKDLGSGYCVIVDAGVENCDKEMKSFDNENDGGAEKGDKGINRSDNAINNDSAGDKVIEHDVIKIDDEPYQNGDDEKMGDDDKSNTSSVIYDEVDFNKTPEYNKNWYDLMEIEGINIQGVIVCGKIKDDYKENEINKTQHGKTAKSKKKLKKIQKKTNNIKHLKQINKCKSFLPDDIKNNMDAYIRKYAPLCRTQKEISDAKFKVDVLLKILSFVQDDAISKDIKFGRTINEVEFKYISNCFAHGNGVGKVNGSSAAIPLIKEIRRQMGDFSIYPKRGIDMSYITAVKVFPESSKKKKKKLPKSNLTNKIFKNGGVIGIDDERDISLKKGDESKTPKEIDWTDICDENVDIDAVSLKNGGKIEIKPRRFDKSTEVNDGIIEDISLSHNLHKITKEVVNMINNDKKIIEYDTLMEGLDKYKKINKGPIQMTCIRNAKVTLDKNENYKFDENIEIMDTNTNYYRIKIPPFDMSVSDTSDFEETYVPMTEGRERKLCDNVNNKTLNVDNCVKIAYLTKNNCSHIPEIIQSLISFSLKQSKELPLLKCHGIKNSALVYSCHNKKSYEWLAKFSVANDINMSTKDLDIITAKFKCYFDFDDKYFFDMLEIYNKDVCTKFWNVIKKCVVDDFVVLYLKMDKKSFDYILNSDRSLYVGVDQVTFNIIG
ncbi:uncharacterized protein LOC142984437 [Anticarsia gemmatalis]|uniref:uncharacterized protein LOC142984437 n=1 Tax=Anticarsia gemmatalis TaxID=129554 RepID=UPI003F7675EE